MNKFLSLFRINHKTGANSSSKDHFWYEISLDPFVDWALILSLSTILAMILVAVGAYVYVDGAAKLSSTSPISTPESILSKFNSQELNRITSAFDARAAETVLLDRAYSGPADPSLP
jgi:hypothetical protein